MATISTFFGSLFSAPSCTDWSGLFVADGVWYHPTLASGANGTAALDAFCAEVRSEFPAGASFEPRGDVPLLTPGGTVTFVSVPYVFAGAEGEGPPFVNWGTVLFALTHEQPPRVAYAVETWETKRW